MRTVNRIKVLGAAALAFVALAALPNPAHAGNVVLTENFYDWNTQFSTPLYSLQEPSGVVASAGQYTINISPAYSYAGTAYVTVATFPGPGTISAGTIWVYEGGPAAGGQSSFLTNQAYMQVINGGHVIMFMNVGPGETVTIYTTQWYQYLSPSQVPH